MLSEAPQRLGEDELAAVIGADAAARDRDGRFPAKAFVALRVRGLIANPPIGPGDIHQLLSLLASIGRGDLNVGRIFEGHVNALLLVDLYGTDRQRADCRKASRDGALLGVWNTDVPEAPLRLCDGRLQGGKSFASGVDGLARAIVTVPSKTGAIMILAPLDDVRVDRSWWKPMGMRASGSHIADLSDLEVDPTWVLGAPGDYGRQPWFSAGAVRFAAVHAGGIHAIFDTALAHLHRVGAVDDPYQRQRLGRMGIAVQSAYGWLRHGGEAWMEAHRGEAAADRAIVAANATRCAVEALALDVLETAERAVGAAGMIAPHPLERLVRDLRTYLRQPNPDGALAAVGSAIGRGDWHPGPT